MKDSLSDKDPNENQPAQADDHGFGNGNVFEPFHLGPLICQAPQQAHLSLVLPAEPHSLRLRLPRQLQENRKQETVPIVGTRGLTPSSTRRPRPCWLRQLHSCPPFCPHRMRLRACSVGISISH